MNDETTIWLVTLVLTAALISFTFWLASSCVRSTSSRISVLNQFKESALNPPIEEKSLDERMDSILEYKMIDFTPLIVEEEPKQNVVLVTVSSTWAPEKGDKITFIFRNVIDGQQVKSYEFDTNYDGLTINGHEGFEVTL